jgi:hypothetical protein
MLDFGNNQRFNITEKKWGKPERSWWEGKAARINFARSDPSPAHKAGEQRLISSEASNPEKR